jgi:hypothetical protein
MGWLLPTTTIASGTREIGALSVAPLNVTLSIDGSDAGRVPTSALAKVVVSARDSTGWEWMSRRVSDSVVVFDALPPGTYTIYVDASAGREPLLPVDAARTVIVSSGRAPAPMRIALRTRQLRFSQQPKRNGT